MDSHIAIPELQEQFETPAQQREVSTLGMWIFLVTEVMFFGGLFMAYAVYRRAFATAFGLASNSMDVWLGAVNTAVLICSSYTMVLAVRAAKIGSRKALIVFLILTILFGGVLVSAPTPPVSGACTKAAKPASSTCVAPGVAVVTARKPEPNNQ